MNDAIGIAYHFVNLFQKVFVMLGAKMYFLLAKPFVGVAQYSCRLLYHAGRDGGFERVEKVT